mmetsp:Transcript_12481/g.35055  ORF Transcript_12481/g.35055 Transcript_12481/m.35055 type:complete len:90 (-) Transcript_12481:187-456(-)
MQWIELLGRIASGEGVEPQWSEVEAMNQLSAPKNSSGDSSFLGMATCYCRFLHPFSHIKAQRTKLIKQNVEWRWSEYAEQSAFEGIKRL